MKAIVYERNGDPSVLHLVDRPVPEPGPGEVLVRVAVSGVNPTDWKSRRQCGRCRPGGRFPVRTAPEWSRRSARASTRT